MCGGKAESIHFAPRVLTASRRRSGSGFNQQPKCYIFSFSLELARSEIDRNLDLSIFDPETLDLRSRSQTPRIEIYP